MFEIDKNLQMVLILFLCCTFILYKQKPSMMFDTNGKIKDFGTGKVSVKIYNKLLQIDKKN